MPSYRYENGEMIEVPDTIVNESGELHDDVSATLIVKPNIEVVLHGHVNGTIRIEGGARAEIRGDVGGTVHISRGAEATFYGRMGGTVHVEKGGTATFTSGVVALGTMRVEGVLVNYGTRSIMVSGSGTVDDREGSTVRQPDETHEDGTVVYFG